MHPSKAIGTLALAALFLATPATAAGSAPYIPGAPYTSNGVYSHQTGTSVTYCAQTTDPDGDNIQYVFKWGDGTQSVTGTVSSGTQGCASHSWATAGSYCVTVYAQDLINPIRGESSCRTETATSPSGAPYIPGAPYTSNGVYSHTTGTTVTYCAVTTDPDGSNIQYVFKWGDSTQSVTGTVSSGSEGCASHAWATAGSYCVTVYAQDLVNPIRGESSCRTETATSASGAPYIPGAPYTANGVYSHPVGTTVTYCAVTTDPDGSNIQYVFKWGDGTQSVTSTMASGSEGCATHAWTAAGSYCVTVYAQDLVNPIRGESSCRTETATAISGAPYVPGAPYTANGVYSHPAGTLVSYCARTTDPDGDNIQYVFKWGDGTQSVTGTVSSGSEGCASHAWATAGSYCVTVYAQDLKVAIRGESSCRTETATASNRAPVAKFTSSASGLRVTFDASASTDPDGDALSFAWTFGDGATGTGVRPAHTYACGGTYHVVLTASDGRGGSGQDAQDVTLADLDADGDLLFRCNELAQGTSDNDADSDNDGLTDYVESAQWPSRRAVFCPSSTAADSQCAFPHPTGRDLYVEVDWYDGSALSSATLSTIRSAFSNGPAGISFVLDSGQLGGGGQNLGAGGTGNFNALVPPRYDDPSTFAQARHDVFHYAVMMCRQSATSGNGGGQGDMPGDKFGVWTCGTSGAYQAAAFLHELGHNVLGVRHDSTRANDSLGSCPADSARWNNLMPAAFSHTRGAWDCDSNGLADSWGHSTDTADAMYGDALSTQTTYATGTWSAIRLDMGVGPAAPTCAQATGVATLDNLANNEANHCLGSTGHVDRSPATAGLAGFGLFALVGLSTAAARRKA